MAGTNLEPNRKEVSVPFADGLQDPRLGIAQNVMLYKQKDIFNGEFKYLKPRPSFSATQNYVDNTSGVSITVGRPVTTNYWAGYFVLNSINNIYINNLETSGYPTLSGADQTLYSLATNNQKTSSVVIENVSTGSSSLGVPLTLSGKLIVVTDPSTRAYTMVTLGFFPRPDGVAMDGYLFLAGDNGDSIYNSNLNDPTTWSPLVNYIKASQNNGNIVSLCRHKNYVVAFKEFSIEYFYNAGLTNTSPLQRNTAYTKQIGLVKDQTLASWGDDIFFVGRGGPQGRVSVYKLDSSFNCTNISNPLVDTTLDSIISPATTNATCLYIEGKPYYILTAQSGTEFLAYDIEEDVWSTWKTSFIGGSTNPACFTFARNPSALFWNGSSTMMTSFADTTKDVDLSPVYYTINSTVKIPVFDFGTNDRKFLHGLSLSVVTPDTLNHEVSFVKTVGGNRQTITKSTTIGNNMSFKNWGQFVSGYFTYTLTDPSASNVTGLDSSTIRINSVNMEVSKGIS